VLTLRALGEGRISFDSPNLPLDLTQEVEEYLKNEKMTLEAG
jgi:hypothetical protein